MLSSYELQPLAEAIPIHDFRTDSKESVPFRFIALNAGSGYDIFKPHRHNYYEIFFFRKGGGTHTIDFVEVPIKTNSVHFISPGQVHLMNRGPESEGSILLFSREFYYCNSVHSEQLYTFPFLHSSSQASVLELSTEQFDLFHSIIRQVEMETNEGRNHEVLRAWLQLVLHKCKALYEASGTPGNLKGLDVFLEFRKRVETHYRQERNPSFYASSLFVTEKKLNLLCKAQTGLSVGEYIRDRVLLEAKRLLHNADHTVKEIGYFLGFEDPSYFNRFFKLHSGTTALAFRSGQLQSGQN